MNFGQSFGDTGFSVLASLSQCKALTFSDPAVLALLGTLGILTYALIWIGRYATTPGHFWFYVATAGMAWWLITTAFEISAPGAECKLFWSIMAWPGIIVMPAAWAFFLFEYAMGRRVPRILRWFGLGVAPLIFTTLAFTNGSHWLFYGEESRLVIEGGRHSLDYRHGPFFYLAIAYNYLVICSALGTTALAVFRASRTVRRFFSKLFAITLLPVFANLAYLFGGVTFFGVEPTPFVFSISLAGVVWLMLDDRWVDIVAIARDLLYFNARDPILVITQDGRLYDANREARDVFCDYMLAPGYNVLHIEDLGDLVRDLQTNGMFTSAPILTRDLRSFAPRVYPLELSHAQRKLGWAIALIDVSAQKDAAEKAQAADLAKTQFLSTVSHELRTPLTVINGAIEILSQAGDDLSQDKMKRLVDLARENTHSLSRLVDDLLDIQRMDNAEFSIELERVELNELVRKALNRIENYQAEKDVRMIFERDPEPLYVLGDEQRLGQVVTNILSNAIKFSGAPGKVSLKLLRRGGTAQIAVTDNGIGIPENAQDKVFGRFTQVDASDTRNRGGSGLGMHISKQILDRHNGNIAYSSVLGRGTTFVVTLPIDDGSSDLMPENGVDGSSDPSSSAAA
ncbi:MAG: histidine kinase N-terminal 7TM domain-containing protein [Arenibacterium sp.]